MSKRSAQQQIARAFMKLVAESPNKRISVAELTRALEMDRKTFYNYFDNIDNLMVWIYRDYLSTMLESNTFDSWKKICPPSRNDLFDPYPDLLFYARREEEGMLKQAPYFKEMAYHWEEHRPYYSVVFSSTRYISLFDYIVTLFLPVFREYIVFFLAGREMPDVVINFLAEYHVMGVFGRLRHHFTRTGQFIMQNELDPFWNYAHLMMKQSIDSCYDLVEKQGFARLFSHGATVSKYKGLDDHSLED